MEGQGRLLEEDDEILRRSDLLCGEPGALHAKGDPRIQTTTRPRLESILPGTR